MQVLVTGGVGFVGSNLIEKLHQQGHEVISVDNYSTGKKRMNILFVNIIMSIYKNILWNM